MSSTLLFVSAGGVALLILLVSLVWGTQETELGTEHALHALYALEYPKGQLEDLLIDSHRHCGIAWDSVNQTVVLFYVHGSHVNARTFQPLSQLQRVRLESHADESQTLHLYVTSFDRNHFALQFSAHTPQAERGMEWSQKLKTMEMPA